MTEADFDQIQARRVDDLIIEDILVKRIADAEAADYLRPIQIADQSASIDQVAAQRKAQIEHMQAESKET
jgi:hypothetical protein